MILKYRSKICVSRFKFNYKR